VKDPLAPYLELLRAYGGVLDLSSPAVLEHPERQLAAVKAYAEVLPEGARVVDLGSGGGWPGLPLALLRPDLELHLVERRKKRAAFLDLARARLGLKNVVVHPVDVSQLDLKTGYVTAQAVAPFDALYEIVRPVARFPLTLVSHKGPGWPEEVKRLQEKVPVEVFHVKPLDAGELVALRVEAP